MIVHSHGWGGMRTQTPGEFTSLTRAGYGVLSFDQRGFGESGGKAHVENPAFEGRDVRALVGLVSRLPWVLLYLASTMGVLLFLAFGSVVVPLKAIVMNVLSLSATFDTPAPIARSAPLAANRANPTAAGCLPRCAYRFSLQQPRSAGSRDSCRGRGCGARPLSCRWGARANSPVPRQT